MVARGDRTSRIPTFDSIEEEAAFWDTHDTGDFEDEFEPVDVEIATDAGHILSVRVDRPAFRRLSAIAKRRGVNIITLAQTWVLESIEREEAAIAATDEPIADE